MDFHMKQWRNQVQVHESEQYYPSAKMPKLNLVDDHDLPSPASVSALPLFVPQHPNPKITNNMSALFPDATEPLSRTTSYFSMGQWQELELQALIYRYMLAGAAVPPELLYPIKKSLLHATPPPYFLHHPLHHYQPAALLQSGYWGRLAMDPEPGRCRRTDGKKWRCSKEVVGGHKYCERHMHRGRNRSRKPVEIPTSAAAVGAGAAAGTPRTDNTAAAAPPLTAGSGVDHFDLSGPSPSVDLLNLSQSSSRSKHENKAFFGAHSEVSGDGRSDGHVLRHFFDDWPRTTDGDGSNGSPMSSTTVNLNSSSDVSLKLSTGIGDEPGSRNGNAEGEQQAQVNWGSGWTSSHVGSMGGPLAEALRSSSTTSPTSVLHQLPRGSASDTSYVST